MDMMIHPDGIEMSTGGGGMEGGENKKKGPKYYYFSGGCVSARFQRFIHVWGRSVAITLTIWRRTVVYYYYLSSPLEKYIFL